MDDRIAERRADVRDAARRRRLRRTVVTLVLIALAATLVAVERSALVGLEGVEVAGTERLSPVEVRDAADLALGTSTMRLRLGAAAARVEALPLVRDATARRVDPLTVRIEVTERQPLVHAVVGDDAVHVDRDGIVIDVVAADDPPLPVIELEGELPTVGSAVASRPALANAHAVWLELSGPLRAATAAVQAHGPQDTSLLLERGIEVRIGRAERMDEKVRAIGAVLEDIGEAPEVAAIDVRAPSAPVVVGR